MNTSLKPITAPGLIIPGEAPKVCGACAWGRPLANLNLVECVSMPPTPCVIGVQATVGAPQLDVQLVRPNLPRTLAACHLFQRRGAPAP